MSRTVVTVELFEVHCRNPTCRILLCQACLPTGSVVRHKCRDCNWYTDTVAGGGRLTMLTTTMAAVQAA